MGAMSERVRAIRIPKRARKFKLLIHQSQPKNNASFWIQLINSLRYTKFKKLKNDTKNSAIDEMQSYIEDLPNNLPGLQISRFPRRVFKAISGAVPRGKRCFLRTVSV